MNSKEEIISVLAVIITGVVLAIIIINTAAINPIPLEYIDTNGGLTPEVAGHTSIVVLERAFSVDNKT